MTNQTTQEKTHIIFMSGIALMLEALTERDGKDIDHFELNQKECNEYFRWANFLFDLYHPNNDKVLFMSEKEIFKTFIN